MTQARSQTSAAQPAGGSAWSPLALPLFRALWIASVVSNIGTWMHEIGEGWLMTSLSPSPAVVALVSTASSFAIFLLALPAGALADVVDRRRMLLVTQTWMLVAAALLGVLTLLHVMTPVVLLILTFAMGIGAAMNLPPFQAIVSELVPRSHLPAAVALGSLGFNVARAVGPAIGGVLLAAMSPGIVFLLNAVSFLGVILTLYHWRRTRPENIAPAERMLGSMRAGVRYVRHSPAVQAVLVRTGVFTFCASALWSLMPTLARRALALPASGYGALVSAMGAGAVLGAVALPRVRARRSVDALVVAATLLFAAMFAVFALVRLVPLVLLAMGLAGVAWIAMMSSLNVAVQTASPTWVRARVLAVHVLVFQGGFALGSALWGALAARFGLATAFGTAAAGLVLGLAAAIRHRLAGSESLDLTPSAHWPMPAVAIEPELQRGPVLVTVEYTIDPDRANEFANAMEALSRQRRRDGAMSWGLYHDVSEAGRFVETFLVESWAEHLRQHERVTVEDRAVEERVDAFHVGATPPRVTHLLAQPIYARDGGRKKET
jgi:MFS family permease